MKLFNLSIPISKVDEEQRIVYGYATKEELDRQGDIVDYEASKKAFSAWAGNIREQHDAKRVIGKKVSMEFDDDNKQILVGAYVSKSPDGENAWTKVKEGLFTGFSIGGKIKSIVKETMSKDDGSEVEANRIMDYDLSELSLVDVPACPSAQLVMVKSADGKVVETEELHQTTDGQPLPWFMKSYAFAPEQVNQNRDAGETKNIEKSKEQSTMADANIEKVNVHAGEERDANAEVVEEKKTEKSIAVHGGEARDENAETVVPEIGGKTEEEAAAHVAEQRNDEAEAVVEEPKTEAPAGKKGSEDEEKSDKAEMKKGLYSVSQLGDLIQNLCWIAEDAEFENQYEGDDSTVPGQLKAAIKTLVGIYKQMAQEEADEAAGGSDDEVTTVVEDDDVELADQPTDLQKSLTKMVDEKLAATNDSLVKSLTEAFTAKVGEVIKPLEERIAKMESTPVGTAPKAQYHEIDKVADTQTEDKELLQKVADVEANPGNYSLADRMALTSQLFKNRNRTN